MQLAAELTRTVEEIELKEKKPITDIFGDRALMFLS
jgi:hypothetical protein